MANVSDGHIAVQVIERIGCVRHNDALRFLLGVDLVHGMNGCLYAEILATTVVVVVVVFILIRKPNGQICPMKRWRMQIESSNK